MAKQERLLVLGSNNSSREYPANSHFLAAIMPPLGLVEYSNAKWDANDFLKAAELKPVFDPTGAWVCGVAIEKDRLAPTIMDKQEHNFRALMQDVFGPIGYKFHSDEIHSAEKLKERRTIRAARNLLNEDELFGL